MQRLEQTMLERAIESTDIEEKEALSLAYLEALKKHLTPQENFEPKLFSQPSYASFCEVVSPKVVKNRKDFQSKEGLATLVHSIAHIEYSAIDLALDAVYRYAFMPLAYHIDWLEVALDEIRHFKMLETLLKELGFSYGSFPVHSGLFDASVKTASNILERMAIVPRYFEASGLDVNPQIVKKLANKHKIPAIKSLIEMLDIIYEEEIIHVQKGDKWFKYLCAKEGIEKGKEEEKYFEILKAYQLYGKHRPHINVEARKEAGFSCDELKTLGAKSCE